MSERINQLARELFPVESETDALFALVVTACREYEKRVGYKPGMILLPLEENLKNE
jgi:hypothetical protein